MRQIILLIIGILIFSCEPDKPIVPIVDTDDLSKISYSPQNFIPKVPETYPKMDIPADNPLTVDGIALGRKLFYDPILSKDSTISCASCHNPALSFTDGTAKSKGVAGTLGNRSAMSLINVGFYKNGLFWDGRVKTLEEQALLPVEDPTEMHSIWGNVIEKLKKHKNYPSEFRKAFGISNKKEINKELTVKALAQFERTLISTDNSKFDKIRKGEATFTDDELIGYLLFFDADSDGSLPDAQCGHCHTGALRTINDYVNNGLKKGNTLDDFKDKGRGSFTGRQIDNGKMRIPTLHNITLTAPYMHDGSLKTLEEVVEHYATGGNYADNLDPLISTIKLNTEQKQQLIAFMKTLTDSTFIKEPAYQNPFK